MTARFPLQTLLDHARHRMAAAERLLLMIKRKEDAARLKQEELERYRREYLARLAGDCQGGIDIQMLRDFHSFLGKLELAIDHQGREVEQIRARWQEAQKNWLTLRQKVKSYEVLERRHLTAESHRLDRREQRQSDELASHKAAVARLVEPRR